MEQGGDCVLVYLTAASRTEAERLGRALVEARVAACANILDGMQAIYRWQGQVEAAPEAVLLAKTTQARLPELEVLVKQLHSYQCPCIVALPLLAGSAEYLAWLRAQVAP